jgi:hypothetical protein
MISVYHHISTPQKSRSKSTMMRTTYAKDPNPGAEPAQPADTSALSLTQKKSFTERYKRRERATVDEMAEYFKLAPEDFDT